MPTATVRLRDRDCEIEYRFTIAGLAEWCFIDIRDAAHIGRDILPAEEVTASAAIIRAEATR